MTTLLSSFALGSDGLNPIPNSTFLLRVPASPGHRFKNHHNVVAGKTCRPEKKVCLALVQTSGLGSWTRPGRGSIPDAWEVPPRMLEMCPALLDSCYDQATPNDAFISALSGSSDMYPRAFSDEWRPEEIARARALMERLELKVFIFMDYYGRVWVRGPVSAKPSPGKPGPAGPAGSSPPVSGTERKIMSSLLASM